MKIWILMVWDYDDWEILSVLFDEAIIASRVMKLFKESEYRTSIKVECWYKSDTNSTEATFLDDEVYWRDDCLTGE